MRILVIGGTRFLGCHIAEKIVADSHEVSLFNRGLTSYDLGRRNLGLSSIKYGKTTEGESYG